MSKFKLLLQRVPNELHVVSDDRLDAKERSGDGY